MRRTGCATALLLWTSLARCQTINVPEARAHDGENATVCGIVGNEHTAAGSQGKPTFLDLDSAFPNQVFAILVWDQDRQRVGALPHKGEHVCVSGTINYYHGVPQVVVRNSAQFHSSRAK